MINEKKLFTCRGGNLSIRLYSDRMMIYSARWMSPRSYELPIDRIRTVVVERKSVIPFATATVLAAVSAVVECGYLLGRAASIIPCEVCSRAPGKRPRREVSGYFTGELGFETCPS